MPTSTLALFIVDGQEQRYKLVFQKVSRWHMRQTRFSLCGRKDFVTQRRERVWYAKQPFLSTISAFSDSSAENEQQIAVLFLLSLLFVLCVFCFFFPLRQLCLAGCRQCSHNGLRERQPGTIWAEGGRFMLLFLRAILARFQQFKTLAAERQRKQREREGESTTHRMHRKHPISIL